MKPPPLQENPDDEDRAWIYGGAGRQASRAIRGASMTGWRPLRSQPGPSWWDCWSSWTPGRDLYVSVLVVYEVNNLLAGVDMTERVVGAWMHEKMD
jgi:hypothetical protein